MNFRGDIGAASDPVGNVIVGEFLQALRDLEDRFDLLIGEVIDQIDVPRVGAAPWSLKPCYGPIGTSRQVRTGLALAAMHRLRSLGKGLQATGHLPLTGRLVREADPVRLGGCRWRRADRSPSCARRFSHRPQSARARRPRSMRRSSHNAIGKAGQPRQIGRAKARVAWRARAFRSRPC